MDAGAVGILMNHVATDGMLIGAKPSLTKLSGPAAMLNPLAEPKGDRVEIMMAHMDASQSAKLARKHTLRPAPGANAGPANPYRAEHLASRSRSGQPGDSSPDPNTLGYLLRRCAYQPSDLSGRRVDAVA